MKKVITLALVIIMLFSFTTTALANANSIEPRDGFSWGFSYSDPSGGNGTYITGQWENKTAILGMLLKDITKDRLIDKMVSSAGEKFKWSSVKAATASIIIDIITDIAAAYGNQDRIFFKERLSPHSVLPGWYMKCEEVWYWDSGRTQVIEGSQKTYYTFKA